ncbi:MAG: glutamate synthase large subunit [Spirochaetes bacterium]|nr:glutamate synthase large subunit [Spirochaetota bacterium]
MYLRRQIGLYDSFFEHDSCGVGFICHIKGVRSNHVVLKSIEALRNLSHRGATGADPKTGDGAGILLQIPHEFLKEVCPDSGIDLPEPGEYGMGLVFLPGVTKERDICRDIFIRVIEKEGQTFLGWRKVPVNNFDIGKQAKMTEPVIEQAFIKKSRDIKDELAFERKLYIIRKQIERAVGHEDLKQRSFFYITNLSSRTISYKGLLTPGQLNDYFLDLRDKRMMSSLCLIHSRYSTNTFPTWDLAQPFRFLAHNGEINTLRGNINWMKAREGLLQHSAFGNDIKKIMPVIVEGGSDSAIIDNVFELLSLYGRSLPHVMMMLIPAAWEHDGLMKKHHKDFYRYHSCLTEPWDGPAAITFTDGKRVGAVLDRNGLRPARYVITKDEHVIMASEVGVLDIPPSQIVKSGRLEPGKIFYIDTEKGKIVDDHEVKEQMAIRQNYGLWLNNLMELDSLPSVKYKKNKSSDISQALQSYGYTREDMKIIKSMAENAAEPVGSMGNDTPHAILSKKPQLLYTYFKQLFAQVTNPAIDPIREEIVMSLGIFIGPEKNILEETPGHSRRLYVKDPVLSDGDLLKIKKINKKGFRTRTISILFKANDKKDFVRSLDRICDQATKALKEGYTFLVLSDRGSDKENAPLPALLACGAVHQHLIRIHKRTQISLIIESAEPREVHHFALLFGYGADCINPTLAYEAIEYAIKIKQIEVNRAKAIMNYRKAVGKGILKILSKMGISTLQSYRGSQIFEALGIGQEVIDRCFTGTVSRIGGITFDRLAGETIRRHQQAYRGSSFKINYLPSGGLYQWKRDGEFHLWNPSSIAALQEAVRKQDYDRYREFASLINDQSENPTTLRGILKFKKTRSIPLGDVEPAEDILKRFVTGAMSFGSISKETHETIAIAMNRLGGRSNTGEGGEDPIRFMSLPNNDSMRSAVKQVASGRFGVTTNYLTNADEIQIKIAQGAKPGEGGQLPGHKVSVTIARTRYTTPGVTLISPPPHHDIYSIEDLAQLIFDLKNTNPKARISVKLVSEVGVGTIAAGVAKGHADMILISGGDGGTGASPLSSIKHAGLPWEMGLSETHQTLVLNDLRGRVRLQTDGQMRTGRDVAIAALLGAEEYGFCTSVLIVLGCVMLRHCHLNNCSVGVATQEEILRRRFSGRAEYVENFLKFVCRELRDIMASLGIGKIEDMIGRTDLLELNKDIVPEKAREIDFSRILYRPAVTEEIKTHCVTVQNHRIEKVLDRKLIELTREALNRSRSIKIELLIKNTDRATGAMLSGEVCRLHGERGLPEDFIYFKFKGVAGQSFGAWLAKGITFELEGMANDYVGKGISGGKIIIYPSREMDRILKNIIIGNTTFYGAISGEAYIRGVAGERFCIRNSGLYAVVEGVGDHGCEYMTGGRVVILGPTGRNFAAGMSGGIAYVYNQDNDFKKKCNLTMVVLEKMNEEDITTVRNLINNHIRYTKSDHAARIMDEFSYHMSKFVKVMPLEYKRILESKKVTARLDLMEEK